MPAPKAKVSKKPSVPIDGSFATAPPVDNRIWQQKVYDSANDWGDYLLGPHQQPILDTLSFLSGFSPGQAIEDTLDASKTLGQGVINQNPWEAGIGIGGLLTGFLPGKNPAKEFDLIHGTKHKFAPIGNETYGRFDLGKALTGEGTNYEGKGIYATDPKAKGVATSYAHMGSDVDPTITIGDTPINEFYSYLKSTHDSIDPNLDDKLKALDKLEQMIYLNNQSGKPKSVDSYIIDILNDAKKKAKTSVAIYDNNFNQTGSVELDNFNPEIESFLNTLRGKDSLMVAPGGYIYDFKVHDSPDNFINMHLPLQYQDDKIIKGVDEWLKNMPISAQDREKYAWSGVSKGSAIDQNVRDWYRQKFLDDPYFIPKESMSKLLQGPYINEHMDLIKDQGILGQKWIARHANGPRYRVAVKQLFESLAEIDSQPSGTVERTRAGVEDAIKKLEDKFMSMDITDSNFDKLSEMQTKINMLNKKLMDMTSPDDIAEKLWKIFNDPNLAYNYVINDPSKTTITGRKFIPK